MDTNKAGEARGVADDACLEERSCLLGPRRKAREVRMGTVVIGGDHPITVQTMTATDTADVEATVAQIEGLVEAGAEIMRVTVDTPKAAKALPEIRRRCPIPLVADIHYNHRLALESAPYVDKIRINPGNIGGEENVRAVIERANEFDLPIRVGVNQGSLEKDIAIKHGAQIVGFDDVIRFDGRGHGVGESPRLVE